MINSHGLRFAYAGSSTPIVFPDVQVPQGHVLVLRGASGSGKSTWLSLLAALVTPHSGTLCVAQQDLTTLAQSEADAWRARTIGFLPQKLHLSAALSVEQNLALAFWAAGVEPNPARIRSVLAELGVADLAPRLPAQLSGGQAQRVALARAVLQHPCVLLADEPSASLDDGAATDAVRLLLSASHTHGATLVIATHDARVAQVLTQQGYDATRCTFLHLDHNNAHANATHTQAAHADRRHEVLLDAGGRV